MPSYVWVLDERPACPSACHARPGWLLLEEEEEATSITLPPSGRECCTQAGNQPLNHRSHTQIWTRMARPTPYLLRHGDELMSVSLLYRTQQHRHDVPTTTYLHAVVVVVVEEGLGLVLLAALDRREGVVHLDNIIITSIVHQPMRLHVMDISVSTAC